MSIGGTHDLNKGYGGALEFRFAPRTGTKIRTAAQEDAPDSDRVPAAWAELTGDYGGKQATTRVTEDSSNPGAPNGVDVTDDFPKDHPHHRGISWMWPVVIVDNQTYDLWTIKGILDRFEKWERKKAGKESADLAYQGGWYVGDRKVVQENVEIVAHALLEGRRDLDVFVTLHSGGARKCQSAVRTI